VICKNGFLKFAGCSGSPNLKALLNIMKKIYIKYRIPYRGEEYFD